MSTGGTARSVQNMEITRSAKCDYINSKVSLLPQQTAEVSESIGSTCVEGGKLLLLSAAGDNLGDMRLSGQAQTPATHTLTHPSHNLH